MDRTTDGGFPHARNAILVVAMGLACGRGGPSPVGAQLGFWNQLRSLCGLSFAGELTTASSADSAMLDGPLVLNIWQCYHREMRLAFHAGDDHSRVWLLTPIEGGLRLSHTEHTAKGEPGEYSGYGGETRDSSTTTHQEFHPDVNTVNRIPSSAGTVWIIEVLPNHELTYAIRSADGRTRFRVEFDLVRRVSRPPPPWGYTRVRGSAADSGPARDP